MVTVSKYTKIEGAFPDYKGVFRWENSDINGFCHYQKYQ
jgi:hypothetical protein